MNHIALCVCVCVFFFFFLIFFLNCADLVDVVMVGEGMVVLVRV